MKSLASLAFAAATVLALASCGTVYAEAPYKGNGGHYDSSKDDMSNRDGSGLNHKEAGDRHRD